MLLSAGFVYLLGILGCCGCSLDCVAVLVSLVWVCGLFVCWLFVSFSLLVFLLLLWILIVWFVVDLGGCLCFGGWFGLILRLLSGSPWLLVCFCWVLLAGFGLIVALRVGVLVLAVWLIG